MIYKKMCFRLKLLFLYNEDLYLKLRKNLIDQKLILSPRLDESKQGDEKEMKKWADNLTNLFFSFASNRPQHYGIYK